MGGIGGGVDGGVDGGVAMVYEGPDQVGANEAIGSSDADWVFGLDRHGR